MLLPHSFLWQWHGPGSYPYLFHFCDGWTGIGFFSVSVSSSCGGVSSILDSSSMTSSTSSSCVGMTSWQLRGLTQPPRCHPNSALGFHYSWSNSVLKLTSNIGVPNTNLASNLNSTQKSLLHSIPWISPQRKAIGRIVLTLANGNRCGKFCKVSRGIPLGLPSATNYVAI